MKANFRLCITPPTFSLSFSTVIALFDCRFLTNVTPHQIAAYKLHATTFSAVRVRRYRRKESANRPNADCTKMADTNLPLKRYINLDHQIDISHDCTLIDSEPAIFVYVLYPEGKKRQCAASNSSIHTPKSGRPVDRYQLQDRRPGKRRDRSDE